MQLVDSILSDNKIDRLDKIEKLESILSSAALLQQSEGDIGKCCCNCHGKLNNGYKQERVLSPADEYVSCVGINEPDMVKENHSNVSTQTLSTGDIVVTKIYFNENAEWHPRVYSGLIKELFNLFSCQANIVSIYVI